MRISNKLSQNTLDRLNELLEFCHVPRTRREISLYMGVTGASITHFTHLLKGAPDIPGSQYIRINEHAMKIHGAWACNIVTVKYPFVAPMTEREKRESQNLVKMESPFLRTMFGFTDHVPDPSVGKIHNEDKDQMPMPKVITHQRVWVSGSTLSMAG